MWYMIFGTIILWFLFDFSFWYVIIVAIIFLLFNKKKQKKKAKIENTISIGFESNGWEEKKKRSEKKLNGLNKISNESTSMGFTSNEWEEEKKRSEKKLNGLNKISNESTSMGFTSNGWEEAKKQKKKNINELKKKFQPVLDNEKALLQVEYTVEAFHENHEQSLQDIKVGVEKIGLPEDLTGKEAALRRELNKYYKKRADLKSKAIAIQLAFEHAKLLLQSPENGWKNFMGLQKLQSNLKSVEYFNDLLVLMHAFKRTFPNSTISEKLSRDIERMFELWNSQNVALYSYKNNLRLYNEATSDSDRHFIIFSIVEYLDRRYRFNYKYKEALITWCLRDVELYENFLKELNYFTFSSINEQMEHFSSTALMKKKISKQVNFESVKKLKDFIVPLLNSYDVLNKIYSQEKNTKKLRWLKGIGEHIGYIKEDTIPSQEKIEDFDYQAITDEIEILKSGQKGKLGFLNSNGFPCSSEEAFQDYSIQKGWRVMRAEVSFWQAMFCLTFWEEIFQGMGNPSYDHDIPHDLFQGETFYTSRQKSIDSKYKQIKNLSLPDFINGQISLADGSRSRLVYDGGQDMITYSKSSIVQEFFNRINTDVFARIVYRIAQNPNENRSGVFDFVIWNDSELMMIEVKKLREPIRESQKLWLSWMLQEDIPAKIVRIKPI